MGYARKIARAGLVSTLCLSLGGMPLFAYDQYLPPSLQIEQTGIPVVSADQAPTTTPTQLPLPPKNRPVSETDAFLMASPLSAATPDVLPASPTQLPEAIAPAVPALNEETNNVTPSPANDQPASTNNSSEKPSIPVSVQTAENPTVDSGSLAVRETTEYSFEEAKDYLTADYAAAVIVKSLTASDLSDLVNQEVEVGITVIRGKTVLFTSGSHGDIRVNPVAQSLLAESSILIHTHPEGMRTVPSQTDIDMAGSATEYLLSADGVYAYNHNGLVSNQPLDDKYLAELLKTAQAPEASTTETRAVLNTFIASIDQYNANPEQTSVFREASGKTLTVSQDGSGNFTTIQTAIDAAQAGDTVFINGGVYHEEIVIWAHSGTAESPITISGVNGATVIIDGDNANTGSSLVTIWASHVIIKNLEIRNSASVGLYAENAYTQVINLNVHHNQSSGIILENGASYSVVEGCSVWDNDLENENFKSTNGWGSGLSVARGSQFTVLRNNTVWNNWGEGLSTFETTDITMEDNVVYDNLLNVYLSDTQRTVLQRNLIYSTPGNRLYSSNNQVGIALADETYNPTSSDIKIVNNVVAGCTSNLNSWGGEVRSTDGYYGHYSNILVANNTFVNSVSRPNVSLSNGNHNI